MVAGTRVSAVGIILLVAGLSLLIVGGSQLFFQLQKNGILLNNVGLKAGDSIAAVIGSPALPATSQLNAITIVSQPQDVPVVAEIKSSSGETVSQFKVDKNPFITSFTGQSDREYILEIKNTGDKEVTLQAAVINIPTDTSFPGGANLGVWQSNMLVMGLAVVTGAVLSIGGIIIVAIGVFETARHKSAEDKKQKNQDPSKYPYTRKE
jgi:uncharacterized membrane protein